MKHQQQLPAFVYGTLRPACGNYHILRNNTTNEETSTLEGYEMWGSGCPFIMANPDSTITGTLMHIDSNEYDKVMKNLDALEGYRGEGKDNFYERKIVTVTTETGETHAAWVYIVEGITAENIKNYSNRIPDGNWYTHLEEIKNLQRA